MQEVLVVDPAENDAEERAEVFFQQFLGDDIPIYIDDSGSKSNNTSNSKVYAAAVTNCIYAEPIPVLSTVLRFAAAVDTVQQLPPMTSVAVRFMDENDSTATMPMSSTCMHTSPLYSCCTQGMKSIEVLFCSPWNMDFMVLVLCELCDSYGVS